MNRIRAEISILTMVLHILLRVLGKTVESISKANSGFLRQLMKPHNRNYCSAGVVLHLWICAERCSKERRKKTCLEWSNLNHLNHRSLKLVQDGCFNWCFLIDKFIHLNIRGCCKPCNERLQQKISIVSHVYKLDSGIKLAIVQIKCVEVLFVYAWECIFSQLLKF